MHIGEYLQTLDGAERMNVAIVGSDSYVGRHLCVSLKAGGGTVHAYNPLKYECLDPETGMVLAGFDLPAELDAVVYLAQSPYYRNTKGFAWHLMAVNALSPLKVAELAVKSGIRKFIYASTGNVYVPSFAPLAERTALRRDSLYALSKIHAEESLDLLRGSLDITIVRPFGIYGPGQRDKLVPNLIGAVASGKEIYLDRNPFDANDDGGLKISLCYIDDAIALIQKLLSVSSLPIVNLAGNKIVNVAEVATHVGNYLGVMPRLVLRENVRDFDLVADASLLESMVTHLFVDFRNGINNTLNEYTNTNTVQ